MADFFELLFHPLSNAIMTVLTGITAIYWLFTFIAGDFFGDGAPETELDVQGADVDTDTETDLGDATGDKSFVDKILADSVQKNFVRSIIDMAHTIGLQVTAEGVESPVQLENLVQYGCDCVQGYIFSKPITPEEALRFTIHKATN